LEVPKENFNLDRNFQFLNELVIERRMSMEGLWPSMKMGETQSGHGGAQPRTHEVFRVVQTTGV
jgi:hypothetical protein